MLQVLIVIAPLFIIIFASAFIQRLKNIGEEWSAVLNSFSFNVGLPVLIFSALIKTNFSFQEQGSVILSNSLFCIGSLIVAVLIGKLLRLKKKIFRTFILCLGFGNVAYLGIPILSQIFGKDILSTASLIVAVYLFSIFTLRIGFLDYEKNKKEIFVNTFKHLLKNPLLIAVVLGILIASLHIMLPEIILKSLDMVTASVTPTVLIVIGLFIGKSSIGKIGEWIPIFLFSVLMLLVLPAGFYFGIKFLGFEPKQFASSIIQAAMPLAITPFALAEKFDLDKKFIARSIVLSTILAVVSLPFWISIL